MISIKNSNKKKKKFIKWDCTVYKLQLKLFLQYLQFHSIFWILWLFHSLHCYYSFFHPLKIYSFHSIERKESVRGHAIEYIWCSIYTFHIPSLRYRHISPLHLISVYAISTAENETFSYFAFYTECEVNYYPISKILYNYFYYDINNYNFITIKYLIVNFTRFYMRISQLLSFITKSFI